ncbi:reverse transcriptase [Gossypium australe]|uniref:Reverse transcriptase n=1 Tax=Gossypium australe TaxID=47621 RepID=A0A5B6UX81_9ROSI|nr:reverse transcriptase [Gossypium australe]
MVKCIIVKYVAYWNELCLRFLHTRMVVDASTNGTLFDKSYNEAYEILERIANNDYQYRNPIVGTGIRVSGAMELDTITSLTSQLSGVVNDAAIEERSSDFTNKKNSKLVVEQAIKENSNQKSVEADSLVLPIKIPWQNNLNKWKEGHRHLFLSVSKKYKQVFQFKKFLDVMKQLHINIPLVEAVEKMPNYVIFMKNIISKKIRLGEFETVALTEGCIAILRNKLPTKLKGPGSFTIPSLLETIM